MEGVETDGWVTEMVRYVICPDEDIWIFGVTMHANG